MDSGFKVSSSGYLQVTWWVSDFLVGRVVQVKVDGFLSSKIYPIAGVPQGSVLSPLLFLIYVNDMPDPKHHLNSKSQLADDTFLWARSTKHPWQRIDYRRTWMRWQSGAPNGGYNWTLRKPIDHVLQVPKGNCKQTCFIFRQCHATFVLSSCKIPGHNFWPYVYFQETLWGYFRTLPTKILSHKNVGQPKVGTKPTNNFANL